MSKNKRMLKNVVAGLCATLLSAAPVMAEETSEYYDWEKFYSYNQTILKKSHGRKMMKLPLCRQFSSYGCGVACVQSILRYASYEFDIRQDDLEKALKSNDVVGTKWYNIVDYLNAVRLNGKKHQYFSAEKKEGMTVDSLIKELDKNHPVICAMQAWHWDDATGYGADVDYTDVWEDGHWAIAVGYDDDNIIFMDPSTMGNYTYIPKNKLMERWHDVGIDDNNKLFKAYQWGIVVKVNVPKPDCEKHSKHLYGLM